MRPYGYSGLLTSAAQVLAVFFVATLICFAAVAACTPEPAHVEQEAVVEGGRTPNATLAVDVTNASEMHKLGLPTKTDVMSYHVYGRWAYGYMTDDHERLSFGPYYSLPGGTDIWDKLYGIEVGHEGQ